MQVKWVWSMNAISAINVTNAIITGSPTINPALAEAQFVAIKAAMTAAALPEWWGTNIQLTRVALRDMRTPNNAEIESTGPPLISTSPEDSLPPQTAAVITLRTAKAGKSFRGRIFLPGFNESANDGSGRITSDAFAALQVFANSVPTLYTGGLQLCVASRQVVNRAPGAGCAVLRPSQVTPVTQALIRDNIWDTQRRRRT
jgi:hypothetical protein